MERHFEHLLLDEVEKRRAGRSEREEARWAGGKSQKATDRRQEAEDYRPSPGAGLRRKKDGLVCK